MWLVDLMMVWLYCVFVSWWFDSLSYCCVDRLVGLFVRLVCLFSLIYLQGWLVGW